MPSFHPFRPSQPNHHYVIGDRIHFKMFGRRVNGRKVDGQVGDEEGIWVKGTILDANRDEGVYLDRHFDWNSSFGQYTTKWVPRRHLRLENF